jgi:hypothetical protein
MGAAKGDGWTVLHDGLPTTDCAGKEAAQESAAAAASRALREGHEVHVSVPGQEAAIARRRASRNNPSQCDLFSARGTSFKLESFVARSLTPKASLSGPLPHLLRSAAGILFAGTDVAQPRFARDLRELSERNDRWDKRSLISVEL